MLRLLAILLTAAALAAPTYFYDRNNRMIGRAVVSGNTTKYYDRGNHYTGKAVKSGSKIRYYDRNNRYIGDAK
jgi:hypothetical protein